MASSSSGRSGIALLIVLIALAVLPLARGGNLLWAEAVFGATVALALLVAKAPQGAPDRLFTWSLAIWALWIIWQVLQLIPLPPAVFGEYAPGALAAWQLGEHNGIDSAQSSIALVRDRAVEQTAGSASLFALYILLRGILLHSRRRLQLLLLGIFAIGVSQALYGTLVQLTSYTLDWIEPAAPVHQGSAHGSFPNRNHYAAFLIPSFACGLALILTGFGAQRRHWDSGFRQIIDFFNTPVLLVRAGLLMIVVGIVLSHSRMGNTAFAAGFGIFAVAWLLRTQSARKFSSSLLLFLSILLIDVLVISEHFDLQHVIERIGATQFDRDVRSDAQLTAWTLIERFGPTGAGHGSFAQLENLVRTNPDMNPLIHAHNDHLEFVLEFGWIGYGILSVLLVVHILMALRALRSRRDLNQACGAVFLMVSGAALLHATVEFQFHIPAWRAVFVTLMAMVAALTPARKKRCPADARSRPLKTIKPLI